MYRKTLGFHASISTSTPNFFPGDPQVIPFARRPRRVVFVGRLTPEKGVQTFD